MQKARFSGMNCVDDVTEYVGIIVYYIYLEANTFAKIFIRVFASE